MLDLANMKCTPPQEEGKSLSDAEIEQYLIQVPGWQVIDNEGVKGIGKRFEFGDFAGPLEFALRVGRLAEEEQHHPAFFFAWGRALLSWRTHKVKGLSLNDFIMAAKTDEIYAQLTK